MATNTSAYAHIVCVLFITLISAIYANEGAVGKLVSRIAPMNWPSKLASDSYTLTAIAAEDIGENPRFRLLLPSNMRFTVSGNASTVSLGRAANRGISNCNGRPWDGSGDDRGVKRAGLFGSEKVVFFRLAGNGCPDDISAGDHFTLILTAVKLLPETADPAVGGFTYSSAGDLHPTIVPPAALPAPPLAVPALATPPVPPGGFQGDSVVMFSVWPPPAAAAGLIPPVRAAAIRVRIPQTMLAYAAPAPAPAPVVAATLTCPGATPPIDASVDVPLTAAAAVLNTPVRELTLQLTQEYPLVPAASPGGPDDCALVVTVRRALRLPFFGEPEAVEVTLLDAAAVPQLAVRAAFETDTADDAIMAAPDAPRPPALPVICTGLPRPITLADATENRILSCGLSLPSHITPTDGALALHITAPSAAGVLADVVPPEDDAPDTYQVGDVTSPAPGQSGARYTAIMPLRTLHTDADGTAVAWDTLPARRVALGVRAAARKPHAAGNADADSGRAGDDTHLKSWAPFRLALGTLTEDGRWVGDASSSRGTAVHADIPTALRRGGEPAAAATGWEGFEPQETDEPGNNAFLVASNDATVTLVWVADARAVSFVAVDEDETCEIDTLDAANNLAETFDTTRLASHARGTITRFRCPPGRFPFNAYTMKRKIRWQTLAGAGRSAIARDIPCSITLLAGDFRADKTWREVTGRYLCTLADDEGLNALPFVADPAVFDAAVEGGVLAPRTVITDWPPTLLNPEEKDYTDGGGLFAYATVAGQPIVRVALSPAFVAVDSGGNSVIQWPDIAVECATLHSTDAGSHSMFFIFAEDTVTGDCINRVNNVALSWGATLTLPSLGLQPTSSVFFNVSVIIYDSSAPHLSPTLALYTAVFNAVDDSGAPPGETAAALISLRDALAPGSETVNRIQVPGGAAEGQSALYYPGDTVTASLDIHLDTPVLFSPTASLGLPMARGFFASAPQAIATSATSGPFVKVRDATSGVSFPPAGVAIASNAVASDAVVISSHATLVARSSSYRSISDISVDFGIVSTSGLASADSASSVYFFDSLAGTNDTTELSVGFFPRRGAVRTFSVTAPSDPITPPITPLRLSRIPSLVPANAFVQRVVSKSRAFARQGLGGYVHRDTMAVSVPLFLNLAQSERHFICLVSGTSQWSLFPGENAVWLNGMRMASFQVQNSSSPVQAPTIVPLDPPGVSRQLWCAGLPRLFYAQGIVFELRFTTQRCEGTSVPAFPLFIQSHEETMWDSATQSLRFAQSPSSLPLSQLSLIFPDETIDVASQAEPFDPTLDAFNADAGRDLSANSAAWLVRKAKVDADLSPASTADVTLTLSGWAGWRLVQIFVSIPYMSTSDVSPGASIRLFHGDTEVGSCAVVPGPDTPADGAADTLAVVCQPSSDSADSQSILLGVPYVQVADMLTLVVSNLTADAVAALVAPLSTQWTGARTLATPHMLCMFDGGVVEKVPVMLFTDPVAQWVSQPSPARPASVSGAAGLLVSTAASRRALPDLTDPPVPLEVQFSIDLPIFMTPLPRTFSDDEASTRATRTPSWLLNPAFAVTSAALSPFTGAALADGVDTDPDSDVPATMRRFLWSTSVGGGAYSAVNRRHWSFFNALLSSSRVHGSFVSVELVSRFTATEDGTWLDVAVPPTRTLFPASLAEFEPQLSSMRVIKSSDADATPSGFSSLSISPNGLYAVIVRGVAIAVRLRPTAASAASMRSPEGLGTAEQPLPAVTGSVKAVHFSADSAYITVVTDAAPFVFLAKAAPCLASGVESAECPAPGAGFWSTPLVRVCEPAANCASSLLVTDVATSAWMSTLINEWGSEYLILATSKGVLRALVFDWQTGVFSLALPIPVPDDMTEAHPLFRRRADTLFQDCSAPAASGSSAYRQSPVRKMTPSARALTLLHTDGTVQHLSFAAWTANATLPCVSSVSELTTVKMVLSQKVFGGRGSETYSAPTHAQITDVIDVSASTLDLSALLFVLSTGDVVVASIATAATHEPFIPVAAHRLGHTGSCCSAGPVQVVHHSSDAEGTVCYARDVYCASTLDTLANVRLRLGCARAEDGGFVPVRAPADLHKDVLFDTTVDIGAGVKGLWRSRVASVNAADDEARLYASAQRYPVTLAHGIVVSPDGLHVYVAVDVSTILEFRRSLSLIMPRVTLSRMTDVSEFAPLVSEAAHSVIVTFGVHASVAALSGFSISVTLPRGALGSVSSVSVTCGDTFSSPFPAPLELKGLHPSQADVDATCAAANAATLALSVSAADTMGLGFHQAMLRLDVSIGESIPSVPLFELFTVQIELALRIAPFFTTNLWALYNSASGPESEQGPWYARAVGGELPSKTAPFTPTLSLINSDGVVLHHTLHPRVVYDVSSSVAAPLMVNSCAGVVAVVRDDPFAGATSRLSVMIGYDISESDSSPLTRSTSGAESPPGAVLELVIELPGVTGIVLDTITLDQDCWSGAGGAITVVSVAGAAVPVPGDAAGSVVDGTRVTVYTPLTAFAWDDVDGERVAAWLPAAPGARRTCTLLVPAVNSPVPHASLVGSSSVFARPSPGSVETYVRYPAVPFLMPPVVARTGGGWFALAKHSVAMSAVEPTCAALKHAAPNATGSGDDVFLPNTSAFPTRAELTEAAECLLNGKNALHFTASAITPDGRNLYATTTDGRVATFALCTNGARQPDAPVLDAAAGRAAARCSARPQLVHWIKVAGHPLRHIVLSANGMFAFVGGDCGRMYTLRRVMAGLDTSSAPEDAAGVTYPKSATPGTSPLRDVFPSATAINPDALLKHFTNDDLTRRSFELWRAPATVFAPVDAPTIAAVSAPFGAMVLVSTADSTLTLYRSPATDVCAATVTSIVLSENPADAALDSTFRSTGGTIEVVITTSDGVMHTIKPLAPVPYDLSSISMLPYGQKTGRAIHITSETVYRVVVTANGATETATYAALRADPTSDGPVAVPHSVFSVWGTQIRVALGQNSASDASASWLSAAEPPGYSFNAFFTLINSPVTAVAAPHRGSEASLGLASARSRILGTADGRVHIVRIQSPAMISLTDFASGNVSCTVELITSTESVGSAIVSAVVAPSGLAVFVGTSSGTIHRFVLSSSPNTIPQLVRASIWGPLSDDETAALVTQLKGPNAADFARDIDTGVTRAASDVSADSYRGAISALHMTPDGSRLIVTTSETVLALSLLDAAAPLTAPSTAVLLHTRARFPQKEPSKFLEFSELAASDAVIGAAFGFPLASLVDTTSDTAGAFVTSDTLTVYTSPPSNSQFPDNSGAYAADPSASLFVLPLVPESGNATTSVLPSYPAWFVATTDASAPFGADRPIAAEGDAHAVCSLPHSVSTGSPSTPGGPSMTCEFTDAGAAFWSSAAEAGQFWLWVLDLPAPMYIPSPEQPFGLVHSRLRTIAAVHLANAKGYVSFRSLTLSQSLDNVLSAGLQQFELGLHPPLRSDTGLGYPMAVALVSINPATGVPCSESDYNASTGVPVDGSACCAFATSSSLAASGASLRREIVTFVGGTGPDSVVTSVYCPPADSPVTITASPRVEPGTASSLYRVHSRYYGARVQFRVVADYSLTVPDALKMTPTADNQFSIEVVLQTDKRYTLSIQSLSAIPLTADVEDVSLVIENLPGCVLCLGDAVLSDCENGALLFSMPGGVAPTDISIVCSTPGTFSEGIVVLTAPSLRRRVVAVVEVVPIVTVAVSETSPYLTTLEPTVVISVSLSSVTDKVLQVQLVEAASIARAMPCILDDGGESRGATVLVTILAGSTEVSLTLVCESFVANKYPIKFVLSDPDDAFPKVESQPLWHYGVALLKAVQPTDATNPDAAVGTTLEAGEHGNFDAAHDSVAVSVFAEEPMSFRVALNRKSAYGVMYRITVIAASSGDCHLGSERDTAEPIDAGFALDVLVPSGSMVSELVHLWCMSMTADDSPVHLRVSHLTGDEFELAGGYCRDPDSNEDTACDSNASRFRFNLPVFVTSRGGLRLYLGASDAPTGSAIPVEGSAAAPTFVRALDTVLLYAQVFPALAEDASLDITLGTALGCQLDEAEPPGVLSLSLARGTTSASFALRCLAPVCEPDPCPALDVGITATLAVYSLTAEAVLRPYVPLSISLEDGSALPQKVTVGAGLRARLATVASAPALSVAVAFSLAGLQCATYSLTDTDTPVAGFTIAAGTVESEVFELRCEAMIEDSQASTVTFLPLIVGSFTPEPYILRGFSPQGTLYISVAADDPLATPPAFLAYSVSQRLYIHAIPSRSSATSVRVELPTLVNSPNTHGCTLTRELGGSSSLALDVPFMSGESVAHESIFIACSRVISSGPVLTASAIGSSAFAPYSTAPILVRGRALFQDWPLQIAVSQPKELKITLLPAMQAATTKLGLSLALTSSAGRCVIWTDDEADLTALTISGENDEHVVFHIRCSESAVVGPSVLVTPHSGVLFMSTMSLSISVGGTLRVAAVNPMSLTPLDDSFDGVVAVAVNSYFTIVTTPAVPGTTMFVITVENAASGDCALSLFASATNTAIGDWGLSVTVAVSIGYTSPSLSSVSSSASRRVIGVRCLRLVGANLAPRIAVAVDPGVDSALEYEPALTPDMQVFGSLLIGNSVDSPDEFLSRVRVGTIESVYVSFVPPPRQATRLRIALEHTDEAYGACRVALTAGGLDTADETGSTEWTAQAGSAGRALFLRCASALMFDKTNNTNTLEVSYVSGDRYIKHTTMPFSPSGVPTFLVSGVAVSVDTVIETHTATRVQIQVEFPPNAGGNQEATTQFEVSIGGPNAEFTLCFWQPYRDFANPDELFTSDEHSGESSPGVFVVELANDATSVDGWLYCEEPVQELDTKDRPHFVIRAMDGIAYDTTATQPVLFRASRCSPLNHGESLGVWLLRSQFNTPALFPPNETLLVYRDEFWFSCVTGYNLVRGADLSPVQSGDSVRVCEAKKWTGVDLDCVPVRCGEIPSVFLANVQDDVQLSNPRTGVHDELDTFGAIATLTCVTGYVNFDNSITTQNITCLQSASWQTPQQCQRISCGDLSVLPNMPTSGGVEYLNSSRTRFGDIAYYTRCHTGFELSGVPKDHPAVCGATGEWTWPSGRIVCTYVDCIEFDSPINGSVKYFKDRINGEIARPEEKNGDMVFATDTIAQFACDKNFRVQDPLEAVQPGLRTCIKDMGWSVRAPPTCDPLPCTPMLQANIANSESLTYYTASGEPIDISTGVFLPTAGVEATLECLEGFIPTPQRVTCEDANPNADAGTWSATFACVLFRCADPWPTNRNNIASITSSDPTFAYGSTTVMTCDNGFEPEPRSAATRVCQIDGWSVPNPRCVPVSCGPPPVNDALYVARTTWPNGENRVNATASYACTSDGTELLDSPPGSKTTTCQIDGSWTSPLPMCIVKKCGDYPAPPFATVSYISAGNGATGLNSTALVHCDTGFERVGDERYVCELDGKLARWSGEPPECVDTNECASIDCAQRFGPGSTCINTLGGYTCTPYVVPASIKLDGSTKLAPVAYPPQTTVDEEKRTIQMLDTSGGETLSFVAFIGHQVSATTSGDFVGIHVRSVRFKQVIEPAISFVCPISTIVALSEDSTRESLKCTMGPGAGAFVPMSLYFCSPMRFSSAGPATGDDPRAVSDVEGENCAWTDTLVDNESSDTDAGGENNDGGDSDDEAPPATRDIISTVFRLLYPPPALMPNSLRLFGESTGSAHVVGRSTNRNMVVMFGLNLLEGAPVGSTTVTYGLRGEEDMFPCDITRATATATSLQCEMQSGNMVDLYYRVTVSGQTTVSTDRFSFPIETMISSVRGCPGIGSEVWGTAQCPTVGGSHILTIAGDGFLDPVSAYVNGEECTVQTLTRTEVTCTLPPGSGSGIPVVITSGTQFSELPGALSYLPPTITLIRTEACTQLNSLTVTNCPREGEFTVTISGENFGPRAAQVYVGGQVCANVVHGSASTPPGSPFFHRSVTCTVTGSTGVQRPVLLFQRFGDSSNSASLSFTECPRGTRDNGVDCMPCTPGTYTDTDGQNICKQCAPGSVAPLDGASACDSCQGGMYAPGGTSACLICPVGTFSTGNAERCAACAVGTFAPKPGSNSCSTCPYGGTSDADGAGCHCLSGFFMNHLGKCQLCMLGADCSMPGTTFFNVQSLPGYFPTSVATDPEAEEVIRIYLDIAEAVDLTNAFDVQTMTARLQLGLYEYGVSQIPRGRVTVVQLSPKRVLKPGDSQPLLDMISRVKLEASTTARRNATGVFSLTGYHAAQVDNDAVDNGLVDGFRATLDINPPILVGDLSSSAVFTHVFDLLAQNTSTNGMDPTVLAKSFGSKVSAIDLDSGYRRAAYINFESCMSVACLNDNNEMCAEEGSLCAVCAQGYEKQNTYTCEACGSLVDRIGSVLLSIGLLIVFCALLVVLSVRDTTQNLDLPRAIHSISYAALARIVVCFIQVWAIASQFHVAWGDGAPYFGNLMDLLGIAGNFGMEAATLDCFVDGWVDSGSELRPLFLTTFGWLILPAFAIVFPFIVLIPAFLFHRRGIKNVISSVSYIADLVAQEDQERCQAIGAIIAQTASEKAATEAAEAAAAARGKSRPSSRALSARKDILKSVVAKEKMELPENFRRGAELQEMERELVKKHMSAMNSRKGAQKEDDAEGTHQPTDPATEANFAEVEMANFASKALSTRQAVPQREEREDVDSESSESSSLDFSEGPLAPPEPPVDPSPPSVGDTSEVELANLRHSSALGWFGERGRSASRPRSTADTPNEADPPILCGNRFAHRSPPQNLRALSGHMRSSSTSLPQTELVSGLFLSHLSSASRTRPPRVTSFMPPDPSEAPLARHSPPVRFRDSLVGPRLDSRGGHIALRPNVFDSASSPPAGGSPSLHSRRGSISALSRSRDNFRSGSPTLQVQLSSQSRRGASTEPGDDDSGSFQTLSSRRGSVSLSQSAASQSLTNSSAGSGRFSMSRMTSSRRLNARLQHEIVELQRRVALDEAAANNDYMVQQRDRRTYRFKVTELADLLAFYRCVYVCCVSTALYLLHPNICRAFFRLVACKTVGANSDAALRAGDANAAASDQDGAASASAASTLLPMGSQRFVLADMSLVCFSSEHLIAILTIGLFIFLVWVVGIPFGFLLYLRRNRTVLSAQTNQLTQEARRQRNIVTYGLAFLFLGFQPKLWWWYVIEMYRKVLYVAISIFFPGQIQTQLLLASLVAFLAISAQTAARPFEHLHLEILEFGSLLATFAVFFLGNFYMLQDEMVSYSRSIVTAIMFTIFVVFLVAAVGVGFLLVRNNRRTREIRRAVSAALARNIDPTNLLKAWRDRLRYGIGADSSDSKSGTDKDGKSSSKPRMQRRGSMRLMHLRSAADDAADELDAYIQENEEDLAAVAADAQMSADSRSSEAQRQEATRSRRNTRVIQSSFGTYELNIALGQPAVDRDQFAAPAEAAERAADAEVKDVALRHVIKREPRENSDESSGSEDGSGVRSTSDEGSSSALESRPDSRTERKKPVRHVDDFVTATVKDVERAARQRRRVEDERRATLLKLPSSITEPGRPSGVLLWRPASQPPGDDTGRADGSGPNADAGAEDEGYHAGVHAFRRAAPAPLALASAGPVQMRKAPHSRRSKSGDFTPRTGRIIPPTPKPGPESFIPADGASAGPQGAAAQPQVGVSDLPPGEAALCLEAPPDEDPAVAATFWTNEDYE